jgi:hypothetical protein
MRGAWIGVAALMLSTSGCGGSGGLVSYMAKTTSSVVLIQWQSTLSRLKGTFTAAVASGTPPYMQVSSTSTRFTGTISGGTVTLDFPARLQFFSGPLGPPPLARIHGTLNGGALTLLIPPSAAAAWRYRLTQAGLGAYNTALANLRSRVGRANRLN